MLTKNKLLINVNIIKGRLLKEEFNSGKRINNKRVYQKDVTIMNL